VELSGISFKYNKSDGQVLRDVSMKIPAHSTIGIVGESGAGKSTIAALIPRFYEAGEGTITLDGHDIMQLKQRFLRSSIGIVQQNVFLFDSTIGDNIMYGKPSASEAEMIDAAAKANILEFIESLPDGFDTLVGERGIKLSGGQKQRISIARVFLKDPAVFIFDEATSSLDSESEAAVQKSLELLREDRTTVIIAHRLSTVKCADYLYVLKNGMVVEQGTHAELLENRGYYHSLYTINVF
jgi:ATP-binding cassette subfamily B protein